MKSHDRDILPKTVVNTNLKQPMRYHARKTPMFPIASLVVVVAFLLPCDTVSATETNADNAIDFGLQIRPILAEHCFHCHGPDAAHREANLRLDDEESAKSIDGRSHGLAAIAPSSLDNSELWSRIHSTDPDEVMPPPSARKVLTDAQKQLLRRWIESGATWGTHWSLAPLTTAPQPTTSSNPWAKTPIDAWVLKGLEQNQLQPSSPADDYTLARRLHLDLIGLPPSPSRLKLFVESARIDREDAIRDLVDELLSRPAFGEHWARLWLDLARYADTKGYEKDLPREMWPYRDWVIQAFNSDMPFDQFTIEQIAGDLLENATQSQKIATAFHRTTLANDEGGTDDEEYRVSAVKDRVDTTIQVWMGFTMGCAKCHSHKYDPISMEDYYRFYAIFNQTEDADRYDDEPKFAIPSFTQQSELAKLINEKTRTSESLEAARKQVVAEIEKFWSLAKPTAATAESNAPLIIDEDLSVRAAVDRPERDTYVIDLHLPAGTYRHLRLDALHAKANPSDANARLGINAADPNFVITDLKFSLIPTGEKSEPKPIAIASAKASFEQNGWSIQGAFDEDPKSGWAISPRQSQEHWGIFHLKQPMIVEQDSVLRATIAQQYGNRLLLHRVRMHLSSEEKSPLFADDHPSVKEIAVRSQELDKRIGMLRDSIPKLPILKELPSSSRRVTKIHQRGSFLDPGAEVSSKLPELFTPTLEQKAPDRLAASQWLVDPANPLTPRVMANRIWSQLFGRGLVETEEDFGAQGSLPTHPELLDWLAMEYRDTHRWSLKKLLRTIVLSNTYQQSYKLDDARRAVDPRNDWLSRSSRFRLSAEVIRDQALAISGLLSQKLGGPPVMPPQPDGLWRSTYSSAKWITSPSEDRFRRGIYTYWKRTTPYPSMETFDATTREVCQIRRISTNTPLQALVTLNDPVYVEASIAMAIRWYQLGSDEETRLRNGFQEALARPIDQGEILQLQNLIQRARIHYQNHPEAATEFLSGYPLAIDKSLTSVEIAAWASVTSAVLSLDELLMRP
jgi:hypothetical protein